MAWTGQGMTVVEFVELPLDEYCFTQLIDGTVVVSRADASSPRYLPAYRRRLVEWTESAPERGRVGLPVNVVLDARNVFAPGRLVGVRGAPTSS